MDSNSTGAVVPAPSFWTNSLNSILSAGTGVATGFLNSKTNKDTTQAQAALAAATAQNNQSNILKYILIGGGVLVAVVVVILLLKRK